MAGTPKTIVDEMEEWFFGEACDGFNIMFPRVPGGLDDLVDRVVPELQRRDLFRRRTAHQRCAASNSKRNSRASRLRPNPDRNQWFADSPLEGTGFELLVRGRVRLLGSEIERLDEAAVDAHR